MTGSRGVNLGRRLDRGLYADYIPVVVPQVSAKPPKQNPPAEESCTALELEPCCCFRVSSSDHASVPQELLQSGTVQAPPLKMLSAHFFLHDTPLGAGGM